MTKITRALDKLRQHIENHMEESIEISADGNYWHCCKATLLDIETEQVEGRVNHNRQRFVFLVLKARFDELNLPIQRGLVVRYKENNYQLVIDPKGIYTYNDQHSMYYKFKMDKLEAVARD